MSAAGEVTVSKQERFALVVVGKPTDAVGLAHPRWGELFLVVNDEWCDSSIPYKEGMTLPLETKTFDSAAEAVEFARKWHGHPYWCRPSGEGIVLSVTPKVERVWVGWEGVAVSP